MGMTQEELGALTYQDKLTMIQLLQAELKKRHVPLVKPAKFYRKNKSQ
jgi:hypothetical protein